ncbi:Oxysterol-binding protein-related protein 6 [Liparis tanakae]|uniref:Oxysterol-binding protein n=1 Tax=Liparis tanakae TaxID=230148 RepID=A0A4Z2HHT8_9TELE|nr:Oxysterol-binding protein-related protein 6 [Liparis tanakae]
MDSHGPSLNRSQSLGGLEKSSPTWKRSQSRSSSTLSSSRQIIKDWEVIDDLQVETQAGCDNPPDMASPGICEGYLLKRRKWPLKGWHKRYFVLEVGNLRYSKNQQDVSRGRVQGSLDVSLAVMSINKKSNRIELDAGDILYHMKVNSHELFYIWVTKLQAHRLYKKHEAAAQLLGGFLHTSPYGGAAGRAQRNGDLSAAGVADSAGAPTGVLPSANTAVNSKNLSLEKPKRQRSGKIWGHSRTLSRVEALGMLSSSHLGSSPNLGASTSSIPDYVFSQLSPNVTSPEGKKIQQDICAMSLRVIASLKNVHETLSQERQKLQQVWETNNIHQSNTLAVPAAERHPSHRPPSVADSAAEYFDASDDILCGSSSELSDESGLSKDLARVSMPAPLNEPLNLLQRLCEELEYSELLDTANHTDDPYQRMVYIAAFAISGYATATFRNRYKPFNPVLGETYECHREDRGFRLLSEQVCHHPPISACHADSENFSFWQDQRWKNKFWGKSLEIQPTGMVNVTLPRYGDHYEWNKVVTCIHNVLSQQRYLEHYGEVTIRNLKSDICTCKITFVKTLRVETLRVETVLLASSRCARDRMAVNPQCLVTRRPAAEAKKRGQSFPS